MADNVQFDLVSPERKLASFEASAVQIQGATGDLTAMADHEPTILSLRPGVLSVSAKQGDVEYLVTGGFAEISAQSVSVLAEMALPRAEVTQEIVSDLLERAKEADAASDGDAAAAKAVADLSQVATNLGFTA